MYKDNKDERFVTFKKCDKYPDLKDTFGLPEKINVKDLKAVWSKAIEDLGGDLYRLMKERLIRLLLLRILRRLSPKVLN